MLLGSSRDNELKNYQKIIGESLLKILNKYTEPKTIVIEGSEPYIHFAENFLKEFMSDESSLVSKHRIIINRDFRFGACDLDINYYLTLKPDLIIHLGHNPFPNTFDALRRLPFKYYFIPVIDATLSIENSLLENIETKLASYRSSKFRIGYSIQYKNAAEKLYRLLVKKGYNVNYLYAKGLLEGQILGCVNTHFKSQIDGHTIALVVSSGLFHALGFALYTGVKTFLIDVFNGVVKDIGRDVKKFRSLIAWNIYRSKNYDKYAVIVVKDSHQPIIGGYNFIVKLLDKFGKVYKMYSVSRVDEMIINNLPEDELPIIAGCPRISIDDISRFNRPVLNYEQLQILFGLKEFNEVYPPYNPGI